ncbi:aminopeptidase P N-terminal domain-containing protein [Candidatus Berkiella aquae]|uniref:Xaa-Pro aminopeptidase n=1 Tax=Candidatus Berkiella aquae TaxID=295108 RepID=A0A0Q9Z126_9GAMM|nr:aminopeptidase P N-terminal domain-containing protein [Candidatus Berkiella aquae]MCS5712567.1 aminopeptidase P N-terminal domain-containing protein [Candidatus Berkiella aquae]
MLSQSSFKARRQKVFAQMHDNSIAVLSAAPLQHRNSDTEQPFRQDSYFYYLTGFDETFAIAVLLKQAGKEKFILFCQERDPSAEQWTGSRAGIHGAMEHYGADEAYSISEASLRFNALFADIQTIYFLINNNPAFDKKLLSWVETQRQKARKGVDAPSKFIDLRLILDEMRLFKTKEEIAILSQTCELSAHAHVQAMKNCKVGMYEYEVEAILLYEFYRKGSRHVAYPCIVAAGNNACVLHYTRNNSLINDNELVLVDAGAELQGYAADITRTFPANGRFTKEQQAIYELVLASQMAAIEAITPQATWDQMQNTILQVLVQGLVDLGLLRGDVATLIEEKAYLPFYMHNSGHWLGLDVHDVGHYKVNAGWRKLEKGMVFTVEPGLYIAHDNQQVAEKWRGIGVRIEDDIFIDDEVVVLTKDVPKTVEEITKIMQTKA